MFNATPASILFTLRFSLACAFLPALLSAGCVGVDGASVDSNRYVIYENGSAKRLSLVQVWTRLYFPPLPAPDTRKLALVANTPERIDESRALRAVDGAPVWRRLTPYEPGLYDVAAAMDFGPPGSVLWIIGNYPSVVVAIGPDSAGSDGARADSQPIRIKLGGDLSLVSEQDLPVLISELEVLDTWPSRQDLAAVSANSPLHTRHIKLEKPQTIRQLLEQPPWYPHDECSGLALH